MTFDFLDARERMVAEQIERRGFRNEPILAAMRRVPRHLFVPARQEAIAYDDCALQIGEGQTISQPYMVAVMTEALGVGVGARVLEIGTGSGYQAAILGELGANVVTVERKPALAAKARDAWRRLATPTSRSSSATAASGIQPRRRTTALSSRPELRKCRRA